MGFSLQWLLLLWRTSSRERRLQQVQLTGSVAAAHGLNCSEARGIFLDQGLNMSLLHWQADSLPLRHQGSPAPVLLPGESHGQRSLVGYSLWGSQGVGHDWSDLARIHVWGIREECSCFLTVHHIACRDECLGPKGLGLGSSLRRQEAPVVRLAHLPVWPGHSGPLCTQPDEIWWRLKTLQAQRSSEPSCREFLSAETFLCPLFVTVGYTPESYLCFLLKKKLCKPMESFFPKGWEPRWELTVREDVGKMKIPT